MVLGCLYPRILGEEPLIQFEVWTWSPRSRYLAQLPSPRLHQGWGAREAKPSGLGPPSPPLVTELSVPYTLLIIRMIITTSTNLQ